MNATAVQSAISKEAHQVLDMLDRWDERLQGHLNEKRGHQRQKFRAIVTIEARTIRDVGQTEEVQPLEVIARNLSPSGLAFIHRQPIDAKRIKVCLNPATGGDRLLKAEILRKRQVHNNFWEYGAAFIKEASEDS